MIPAPAKRPFGLPLPPEALAYFCHPFQVPFTQPVRHPGDGLIYAATSFGAIRVRRLHGFPDEFPEALPEFVERVGNLPWHKFDDHARYEWRLMDDARGIIYEDPDLPLWLTDKRRPRLTSDNVVRTAGGPLIPMAVLQLLARLPRPEVRITRAAHEAYREPLLVRSSCGEVIVPALYRDLRTAPVAARSLFNPKSGAPLPGGLV